MFNFQWHFELVVNWSKIFKKSIRQKRLSSPKYLTCKWSLRFSCFLFIQAYLENTRNIICLLTYVCWNRIDDIKKVNSMNRYVTKMKFVVKTKAINNPIKEIIHVSFQCKFIFLCFVGWTCRTTIDDTYLFNFICNFFFHPLAKKIACSYILYAGTYFWFFKVNNFRTGYFGIYVYFLSKCI